MELTSVQYIGSGIKTSDYLTSDDFLIQSSFVNSSFGDQNDYIEYFIYDENQQLLTSNYNVTSYKLVDSSTLQNGKYSTISLDPIEDIKSEGYDRGKINIQYNFLRNLFNSRQGVFYWIKEISNSRKEIKLSSQTIPGFSIQAGVNSYQSYIQTKNYYSDFYINFGSNNLYLAVNAAYVEENDGAGYLLIKLYQPLPSEYDLKSPLWIVDKISESYSYDVEIQIPVETQVDADKLRGPNYNVKTVEQIGQTTQYYSYNSLFSSPISSSAQKLLSYYDDKAININVDYSDFSNFIHFSSATERIKNFAYKIGLIELYNLQINQQRSIKSVGNSAQSTDSSINILQSNIDKIVEKFDTYEYYLYYQSSSYAWPKSNSTQPYQLYPASSSQVVNWLGSETTLPSSTGLSILYSSSLYDNENYDSLLSIVPRYLQDDPSNQPYLTFMSMIGQHFDNVWIYYKDVTNRYDARNNPEVGVSLDLVADAIKSFGIELYTNTNLSDQLYYTLFGIGQDGSLLPPTGSEVINAYVTSSIQTLPYDQVQKEIYKRIYHNLPYLLKTRGTERGVKALISCYGIPDSILTVNQYGGYDRLDKIGVIGQNNDKVTIIENNLELSQSVLSPYSTLQYYDNDNRLNSTVVEIAFSPSDEVDRQISSSLGYFDIDSLIGDPRLQYSSSYTALDQYRKSYFASYSGSYNVWEYIRLVKYYNNSLFKMIKDFTPARATVSSGIVIKPHVLERNKYARHEPSASNIVMSQSIEMVAITGSHATTYNIDSTTYENISTAIGYIPYTSSYGFEKYTGEYQGTVLKGIESNYFDQRENSNNAWVLSQSLEISEKEDRFGEYQIIVSNNTAVGIGPFSILRSATFNNVTNAVRSQKYLDLDFSSNPQVPVNFGTITQSIIEAQENNAQTYNDPNFPYAQLQDFNYAIQRSTIPRYYGSKVESLTYNVYSTASAVWKGDSSYGNSPAIDHKSQKLGFFTQIRTSSFFPNQVNVTMAYLVDQTSGLNELNLLNNNWFEVQNTFKAGEYLTIKQFDNKKYSDQKFTDGQKLIYESGYSYGAMLYFNQLVDKKVYFNFLGDAAAYLEAHNDYPPSNSVIGVPAEDIQYPFTPTGVGNTASMYNIFDNITTDSGDNYTVGSTSGLYFPTYSVAYAGNYSTNMNFSLNITASSDLDSGSFTIRIIKNGQLIATQSRLFGQGLVDGNWYISWGAGII